MKSNQGSPIGSAGITPVPSPDKLPINANIQSPVTDASILDQTPPDTGESTRSRRTSIDGASPATRLNFDGDDKAPSEESMPKISTSDSITKHFQTPAAQFIAGGFAGKAVLSPTLKFATDYINDQNSNKPLYSYYFESGKGAVIGLLKAATQFGLVTFAPSKFTISPIENQLAAKITTDVMFASAEALVNQQVKSLQKIASIEYAKELSVWTIMGIQQIPGLNSVSKVIDFNNLYEKSPAALAAVVAIGPELIDFSTAVGTKVYGVIHDYFSGDNA